MEKLIGDLMRITLLTGSGSAVGHIVALFGTDQSESEYVVLLPWPHCGAILNQPIREAMS